MRPSSRTALLLAALAVVLAPANGGRQLRQIGGIAQGCYSAVNNVDNGVGYATENVLKNVASALGGTNTPQPPGTGRKLSQIGGIAQGCDAAVNNVDNGVGYATENVLKNVATAMGGMNSPQQPGTGRKLSQDGGSESLQALAQELSGDVSGDVAQDMADVQSILGDTSYLSELSGGASTGTGGGQPAGPGKPAPGRKLHGARQLQQENKIAGGAQSVLDALHMDNLGTFVNDFGDATDGQGTDDLAQVGNQVAAIEDPGLPDAANALTGGLAKGGR